MKLDGTWQCGERASKERPLAGRCAEQTWSSRKARERKTSSRPMRRNWEVGPRKERSESVQAAVHDVGGNRPTNGSDDGVLRTGCVATKTS